MNELDIFSDAIELADVAARSRFLDEACDGRPVLRERIEALLRNAARANQFLESPAPGITATIDHAPLEQPGTQIGPYKLLEQIGEGGMGVVYHASQREPVRRTVALKIIKPGMDSREVIRRFEAERQALALMDHPNIAKVFDGGVTGAGRPYFAMELVRGKPITEYCDREQLSTRERLTLFVAVCQGVQHAHQKGIIHRDLKPSNILIKVYDVRPVPVVIDFGIAKATGQQLAEQSLHTAFDQMVGTPLYMSPEQAGQSDVDVDTRSDIYSLGVLLYELLTGQTPFEKDALHTAGFDEMRRIIREVEPPRPSARVSTLQAADLSTVSERRHIEPGKLSQQLRGELDWIVMKALDKDRERRYTTVNDLAADVERYLHDEPVQACPPSVAYRFSKFSRRNRVALVTSGLVALALITGTGVSVWQAIRATNAEVAAIAERDQKDLAEKAAIADRDAKVHAEQLTAQALRTAEERLQFGRQAVDEMYTQVAEKWLAQQAELTVVQKQFLEKALAFYRRLATEESADPAVLFETAKAEQRVGEIQNKLGKHAEAEAAYRHAIELFTQLARDSQEPAEYNQELAKTRRSLGTLLLDTGRLPQAEQELKLSVGLCKALVDQLPDNNQYQLDLAQSHRRMGIFLNRTGQMIEAAVAIRAAVALYEPLLARSPHDNDLKFNLARSQVSLVEAILDRDEQKAICSNVARMAAEVVAADPKNPEYRLFQAQSLFRGQPSMSGPESEDSYRQGIKIVEGLVADFPQMPVYQEKLAEALTWFCHGLNNNGRQAESERIAAQSLATWEKLAAEHPEVPNYRRGLGEGLTYVAFNLMNRDEWEKARPLLERAVASLKAAAEINPKDLDYRGALNGTLRYLTVVYVALGDQQAAARTANDFANSILRETEVAAGADVSPAIMAATYCEAMINFGMHEPQDPGDSNPRRREPIANLLIAKTIIQQAVERTSDDPLQYQIADILTTAPPPLRDPELALKLARQAVELKPGEAMCMQSLGWALYRCGDWKGCIEILKSIAVERPGTDEQRFVSAMAYWQLGEKTEARADFDSASVWLKGYEQKCDEERKKYRKMYPPISLEKRLQAEAAALLGVTLPAAETAPEPAAKVEEAKELPKSTPAPEPPKEEEPSK